MVKEHVWPSKPIASLLKCHRAPGCRSPEKAPPIKWSVPEVVTFKDTRVNNILTFEISFKTIRPYRSIARFLIFIDRFLDGEWKRQFRDYVILYTESDDDTGSYKKQKEYRLDQVISQFPPIEKRLKFRITAHVWMDSVFTDKVLETEQNGYWGAIDTKEFTAIFIPPKPEFVVEYSKKLAHESLEFFKKMAERQKWKDDTF